MKKKLLIKVLSLLVYMYVFAIQANAQNCTQTIHWLGGSGSWYDAAKWSSGAVPGPGDCVVIDSGLVTTPLIYDRSVPEDTIRISSLTITGGTLQSQSYYIISGNLNWSNGTILGGVAGVEDLYYGSSIIVQGAFNISGNSSYAMLLRNKLLVVNQGGTWNTPPPFTLRNATLTFTASTDSLVINTGNLPASITGIDDDYTPFHPLVSIAVKITKSGVAKFAFSTQRLSLNGDTIAVKQGQLELSTHPSWTSSGSISNSKINVSNNASLIIQQYAGGFNLINTVVESQGTLELIDVGPESDNGRISFGGNSAIITDSLVCTSDKPLNYGEEADAIVLPIVVSGNYFLINRGPVYTYRLTTNKYLHTSLASLYVRDSMQVNGKAVLQGGRVGGGGILRFNDSLVLEVPGNGPFNINGLTMVVNGTGLFRNMNIRFTNGIGMGNPETPYTSTLYIAPGKKLTTTLTANSSLYFGPSFDDLFGTEGSFINHGMLDITNTGSSPITLSCGIPFVNNGLVTGNNAVLLSLLNNSTHAGSKMILAGTSQLNLSGNPNTAITHLFDSTRIRAGVFVVAPYAIVQAGINNHFITDSLGTNGEITIDSSSRWRSTAIYAGSGIFNTASRLRTERLYLQGGAWNGIASVTVTELFSWSGGNIQAGNDIKVNGRFVCNTPGSTLSGRTILMKGGGYWDRPAITFKEMASILHDSTDTLTIHAPNGDTAMLLKGDTSLSFFSSKAPLVKTGAGTWHTSIDFNNRDLLDIRQGSVQFTGLYENKNLGIVSGNGILDTKTARVDDHGTYKPGDTIGTLTIHGQFTGKRLLIDVGDFSTQQADSLVVSDTLNITHKILTVQELSVPSGNTFVIAACKGGAGCRVGTFSEVNLPAGYGLSYTDSSVVLTKNTLLTTTRAAATMRTLHTETTFAMKAIPSGAGIYRVITAGNADLLIIGINGTVIGKVKSQGTILLDLTRFAAGMYVISNLTTKEKIKIVR